MVTNAPPYYNDEPKRSDVYEEELLRAQEKLLRQQARQEAQLNVNPPQQSRGNITSFAKKNILNPIFKRSKIKITQKRGTATRNLLRAVGAIPSNSVAGRGRGRPAGTYKYGVPIQEYKKLQAQRRALYNQYASQQKNKYSAQGFSPQQLTELQQQRMMISQNQSPSSVDDELQFQKFVAENTITPNTQRILDNLKRIQNKSITDDLNMQRIVRERKLVNSQQSLLKARNLFGPDSSKLNIFDEQFNILKAPNVFRTENVQNVFANTGRPNILQTREAGNSLFFG